MADNVVYDSNISLFTLKGAVAVHFLDGQVIKGDYVTQDAYNIFIRLDDQPLMIPRQQIRFIKGVAHQPVERDQPADAVEAVAAPPPAPPPPPADVGEVTETHYVSSLPLMSPDEEEDEDDEESTLVLVPEEPAGQAEAADDMEGTLFINPEETSEPGARPPAFEPEPLPAEPESDATMVLPDEQALPAAPSDEFEEDEFDDITLAIGADELEKYLPPPTLTCTSGPHAGQVFDLERGVTTIGRSGDNTVVLAKDKEISRRHAIINYDQGDYTIQDQNSLNGTFVNDTQVSAPRLLVDGDMVLVGISYLKFEQP